MHLCLPWGSRQPPPHDQSQTHFTELIHTGHLYLLFINSPGSPGRFRSPLQLVPSRVVQSLQELNRAFPGIGNGDPSPFHEGLRPLLSPLGLSSLVTWSSGQHIHLTTWRLLPKNSVELTQLFLPEIIFINLLIDLRIRRLLYHD